MKVLVVGNGGREHVLCWKMAQSPHVEKIYCAPGNAGIARVAACVDIPVHDLDALAAFAVREQIDLTVVGPEAPLCDGVVDVFQAAGLKVFGPDRVSAQLEGSKIFAKDFMRRHGIPTAWSETFAAAEPAIAFVNRRFDAGDRGIVIKADGLAAGKGVIVALNRADAIAGINQCFDGAFGDAGRRILVEECLFGEEASILALTDGQTIMPLASAQDHKRVGDGDTGPNTGGMGAYSPAPVVTDAVMDEVNRHILTPFLDGIKQEKLYFRGVLFVGVMVTDRGPKVLEFNVRFGDPEVQAVMMRLENDLVEVIDKIVNGRLNEVSLHWAPGAAVCVVLASGGYPGHYDKGYEITGLTDAEAEGAVVFHAGTAVKDGKIVNAGGRVLGVTALGTDIREAIDKA
ncbi:MAG: phosphoribosylamine--glycine ligase, partial [Victivallales bacterium]|nr:phosphoribosylamine--glycine ligase [Victivallales bacterium]